VEQALPLLLIVHVVISMVVSTIGPARFVSYRRSLLASLAHIAAYGVSLIINLCGFWPISIGLIIKARL